MVDAVKLTRSMTIDTVEGKMRGNPGDYLITDKSGEQYIFSGPEFEKNYDKVKLNVDVKTIARKAFRKIKRTTKHLVDKNK